MQYRTLGRTGLKLSTLCLGTMTFGWSTDEATAHRMMDQAVAHGINCLDTADIYSAWVEDNEGGVSEAIIGRWLKQRRRHEMIVATKVRGRMWEGPNGEGLSRHHIMQAAEDSLRRLQTDYIDLYQVHWPDEETPLDETLRALDDLVRQGKVRYIGASNYPAWLLMKSLWVSDAAGIARFESLQPRYSLLSRAEFENQLIDVCRDQAIGVIPYSPLAAGFLTGKYQRDEPNVDTTRTRSRIIQKLTQDSNAYTIMNTLQSIAVAYQTSTAQLSLAWLLAQDTITSAIIGTRTEGQLGELVGSADLTLTAETLAQLTELTAAY